MRRRERAGACICLYEGSVGAKLNSMIVIEHPTPLIQQKKKKKNGGQSCGRLVCFIFCCHLTKILEGLVVPSLSSVMSGASPMPSSTSTQPVTNINGKYVTQIEYEARQTKLTFESNLH